MSFLKITDPVKRNFIVEELLKSKKNIKQNYQSERVGDIGLQRELTKLYKPFTDTQRSLKGELSSIKDATTATTAAIQALPPSISTSLKAIQFPQYPSIEVYEDAAEDARPIELGDIATKYLIQYAANKKSVDTTFGINSKDGVFYIGDKPITIDGDNVTVGDTTYAGTPGLWELLTMAEPNASIYEFDDLEKYAEILQKTNAISHPGKPSKPKSSKSKKYTEIIRPIWNRMVGPSVGKGVATVVIPQDPNALVEMLKLRKASFNAGNTGVRNEIISICDELLRQDVIDKDDYKKLITL